MHEHEHWQPLSQLTILIINSPPLQLLQPCKGKQLLAAQLGVLDALLNLDTFKRMDSLIEDGHVANGEDECLVATALIAVVDILAVDSPVREVEDLAIEDPVGVGETIEDEPERKS
jgi:hypothetical protein